MERSRVVYYAKTNTSKVINPSTIQRQKSSPEDGPRNAPLAPGEADFPFTPTRSVSDVSQHRPGVQSLNKDSKQTATLPFSNVKAKEMVYKDRKDEFQFSGTQRGATLEDMRLRRAPSAKKIYPGPVLFSPTSSPRNMQPNLVLTTQAPSRKPPVPIQGKCLPSTDDVHMTSSMTRTNGGYIRNTVLSNIATSLGVKRDHEIPFNDFSISPKADLTVYRHSKPSSLPHSPKNEVDIARSFSRSNTNALIAIQKDSVIKFDPVAETTAGDVLLRDSAPEHNEDVVIHWTVNEQNAIICRKLSVKSTRSENEEESSGTFRSVDAVELRKASATASPTPARFTSKMTTQDERYNSDKDSGVQSDNTSQNSETHVSELDDRLDMEVSPTSPLSKWKRNSLRMATQGFTSMSDLTNSLECLQLISSDYRPLRKYPMESVSPTNDIPQDNALHIIPLTPSPGDVLYSSNGQVYTFFEQLNPANPKSSTCTIKISNSNKTDSHSIGTPTSHNVNAIDKRTSTVGSPNSCKVTSENTETNTETGEGNEKVVLAKRHSYIMATSSNSDLSLNNEPIMNVSQKSNPSVERLRNKSFIVRVGLPSSPGLMREESVCSSALDSSFGSFYSCQSDEFVSARSSPYLNRDEQGAKTSKDNSVWRSSYRPRVRPPSSDDESLYCTASDKSFLEPHRGSPGLIKDKPPSPSHRMHTRNTRIPIPLQNKGLSPKSLKKLNTVLQCYGCSVVDKSNNIMMMNRPQRITKNSENNRAPPSVQRTATVNRFQDTTFKRNARLPDSKFRCKSTPTVRLMNFDLRDEIDQFRDDSDSEYDWSEMPRSPPALGRPKRKVYAGFDSQPLPMDSFMSDSSSCYTDCGSWSSRATSKSAEVERSFQGSMDNLTSAIRSASAEAVDTITPTRQMSQNTLLDFFRLGDKHSAVCENNHNVYVRSPEDRGSYHSKTFSNESLHSNLSTATTTSLQQRNYADTDSADFNSLSPGDRSLNGQPKRRNLGQGYNNERRNDELTVDDSKRMSFDFKFRNSQEFLSNSWRSETKEVKVQCKPLKAASSASLSRPRYHPKRKNFSSKDILNLLVTPDMRAQDPGASALEKQAQKVCRAFLCCNDMEASIHSAQYQF